MEVGARCVVAEMYSARDLTATATKDPHLHDGACGDLHAGGGSVDRLPLRPSRRLDDRHLETTNAANIAGQARNYPDRIDDGQSYPAVAAAETARFAWLAQACHGAAVVWCVVESYPAVTSISLLHLLPDSLRRRRSCGGRRIKGARCSSNGAAVLSAAVL